MIAERTAVPSPFTKASPCPVCGGYEEQERGQGRRCYGFLSSDGLYAHCSREEHAHGLTADPNGATYPHRLDGPCPCGQPHGSAGAGAGPSANGHAQNGQRPWPIVAAYAYRDEAGAELYQIVRKEPVPRLRKADKTFSGRRRDGRGGWIWNLNGVRRVLYRLPELLRAEPDEPVFVCEGEKLVDRLMALGKVATTNPHGQGKAHLVDWGPLQGRWVVLLPDNDDVGQQHMARVAHLLGGVAQRIWTVPLDGLPAGGDVCDWLDAGHSVEELVDLAVPWVEEAPAGAKQPDQGNGHHAGAGPGEAGAGAQKRRHIVTMAEFLAEPHEERQDLVEGLIPLAQAGLIVGEGALGKTLLMMELARARSRGQSFLGRKTVPGKTLLCLFDDARSLTKQRCHELFNAQDQVALIAARYDQGDMYPEIAEYVAREQPEVVVVDTLAMITPPTPGAENDPPTMKKAMEPYTRLMNNEKTTVIFLHHDNAEGGVRGTTAIRNNVQWTLSMKATEPDEQGRNRVQCSMRWKYEPIAPFVLTMTALAAFESGATPAAVPSASASASAAKSHKQLVLDALQEAPKKVLPTPDLGTKTGLSRGQLERALRELVGEKKVVAIGKDESTGKRGAKPVLYGLAARPQDVAAAELEQEELFTHAGGEGGPGVRK